MTETRCFLEVISLLNQIAVWVSHPRPPVWNAGLKWLESAVGDTWACGLGPRSEHSPSRITDRGARRELSVLQRLSAEYEKEEQEESTERWGESKLQKRAKEQADEEKEAAIRGVADLATHRGSAHELGMDPKEMAIDLNLERSALEGDDLPVVTPQTVDDLI
ncbi:hypothetical protein NDU88_007149 [Pleurodeles waltl]|uniref:Uncharacterized protein n=1 Tax=Pleurodeles waltl TaxID=8319 RepID=A0AAV7RS64_PLEWA|nr:hypothetical protein NDU88_007149 [Pleurodeles waltl]